MTSNDNLAPCPFCGGAAEKIDIEEDGQNFGGSCICCKACGASSPVHFDRKENLYHSWNKRTVSRPVIEREALEKADGIFQAIENDCEQNRLAFVQTCNSESAQLALFERNIIKLARIHIRALIPRDEEEKS